MTIAVGTLGYPGVVAPYLEPCRRWAEVARRMKARSAPLDVAVAVFDYRHGGDPALLRATISDALRRAPFDPRIPDFCGWGLLWCGDPSWALECFLKHHRLGRFDVYRLNSDGGAAIASVMIGDYQAALAHAERGLKTTNGYGALYRALAAAHAHLGNTDQASAAMREVFRLTPNDNISSSRVRALYLDTPGTRRFWDGLRKAGMPE